MQTMLPLIFKILLLMGFGFVVKRVGLLPDEIEQGLTRLLLSAILPLSILASGDVTLSAPLAARLKTTALLAAGYYLFAIFGLRLLSRTLPLGRGERTVLVVMGAFANTAFLGFPIAQALFGSEGVLYCAVYNIGYQLTFFTWGVSALAGGGQCDLKTLAKTPVTVASAATVLLVLTPLRLPAVLQDAVSSIGGMTTPLSLLLIGCAFTRMRPTELVRDGWSYLVSALRLLVFPLLMLGIVLALRLPAVPSVCCVLLTALPCGSLGAIYAERYDCAPGFAARAVVQTTLLMAVTFPALLLLLGRVGLT